MPYLLSDTHVETNEQYKLLIKWISQLAEDDDVILLGDIFDFTKVPYMELEYMIDDFDHPHIYYVYGNHDIIAPQLGFKCYDKLKYDGLIFEHGHKYEALLRSTGFTTPEEYNELFERLCFERNTAGILTRLSWATWHLVSCVKRNLHKPSMAQELFKLTAKIGNLVLGHTHHEVYSKMRRVLICDDAKLSDINGTTQSISGTTTSKNRPMGYYLHTETFNFARFELNARADIRPALDAKRNCLYDRS